MVRLLGLPEHCRLLEIGCGTGVALPIFSQLCHPKVLVGIDIDRVLLSQAATRLRDRDVQAVLVQGDARQLPFPPGSFDVVVDFGTCYHISRPHDALREVVRVLNPGGIFATETRLGQLLSHPIRAASRRLPWAVVPELEPARHRLLWTSHRKC